MIINFDFLDNSIEINEDKIFCIECENKSYFYRILKTLNFLAVGEIPEEIVIFDKDNNEINLSNKTKLIFDYINFNYENKKIQNKIYELIHNEIDEKDEIELKKSYTRITEIIQDKLYDYDIEFEINSGIDTSSIIKLFKYSVKSNSNILDNIFTMLNLESLFNFNFLTVFVNIKQYLNDDEIKELYKYALYNKLNILLIESSINKFKNEYEKKLIIDDSLNEIVI